jgi:aminopeptidase
VKSGMLVSATSLPLETEPDALLDMFARLAISIGVNVQPRQELIVAAPMEAVGFVRRLASTAYARGASLVTALYDDPELLRTRLLNADKVLDRKEEWLAGCVAQRLRKGAAYLSVLGPRPELLAGVELGRILRAHKAQTQDRRMLTAVIANRETNASAVPFVTRAWAQQVFPEREPDTAIRLLWSALIGSVGGSGTTTAEQTALQRQQALTNRRTQLQARAFRALHFTGPQIRLTAGLAQGHIWHGGQNMSSRGIAFVPVLPAEALFTATAPEETEGWIAFSRPIAIAGEWVDNLQVSFEAGVATRVTVKRGWHAFEQLLNSDPGARRIGTIALVEAAAPLARPSICFHNPMLDGAAAPHIAFGAALPGTLRDTAAANRSAIHIDAMFDAASLGVHGIDAAGTCHAIMRDGVFVL